MPKLTTQPDPNPKTPKLKAPAGACDSHLHLFGPVAKYPFAADSPYIAHEASPETFVALQDTLGLSTAVIVSPGGYGRDTSLLADVLAKYPTRFRGIALVRDDIADGELARLTRLGVRGMRMMSAKRPARAELRARHRRPRP
jgi:2-pyrone-4,6-dicarboxylate lactonase